MIASDIRISADGRTASLNLTRTSTLALTVLENGSYRARTRMQGHGITSEAVLSRSMITALRDDHFGNNVRFLSAALIAGMTEAERQARTALEIKFDEDLAQAVAQVQAGQAEQAAALARQAAAAQRAMQSQEAAEAAAQREAEQAEADARHDGWYKILSTNFNYDGPSGPYKSKAEARQALGGFCQRKGADAGTILASANVRISGPYATRDAARQATIYG